MIRFERDVSQAQARELLRRLRDLCPSSSGIELAPGETIRLLGCLSADQPVERGVHYALERADGRTERLAMRSSGASAIELRVERDELGCGDDGLSIELVTDRFGRVAAPALGARLDLAVCDPRAIEHFLRRLVRAAIARRG